jgi:hypothetical protein
MIEPRAMAIPAGAADRGTGRQREVSFLLRQAQQQLEAHNAPYPIEVDDALAGAVAVLAT